jgi:hypothetical protein
MRTLLRAFSLVALVGLVSCSADSLSDSAFTLYRTSVLDESMRIHIATFDSKDGRDYNQENCELARQLFQSQDGVKTRFWCELGRYRK